eukprot:g9211.t1
MLFDNHLSKYSHLEIREDTNNFREDMYYKKSVDGILTKFSSFLKEVFGVHCSIKTKTRKYMNIKDWIRFCVNAQLIDEAEKDQFVKAFLVYKKSMPIEVDELQINSGTNYKMPFVIFAEALCRCIAAITLHIPKQKFDLLKITSYVDYVEREIMKIKDISPTKTIKNKKDKNIKNNTFNEKFQNQKGNKKYDENLEALLVVATKEKKVNISYFKCGSSLKRANDKKINSEILVWKINCVFQVWKERFKLTDRKSIVF